MSWIIDRKDDQKYQGDGAKPVTVEQYIALIAGKSVDVNGETWTVDNGPFYVPEENLAEHDEAVIEQDDSEFAVSKADFMRLIRGEMLMFGPMRRAITLRDGPFVLLDEDAPIRKLSAPTPSEFVQVEPTPAEVEAEISIPDPTLRDRIQVVLKSFVDGVYKLIGRGGEGSGHHEHEGRPGEVGGSLPSGEGERVKLTKTNINKFIKWSTSRYNEYKKKQIVDWAYDTITGENWRLLWRTSAYNEDGSLDEDSLRRITGATGDIEIRDTNPMPGTGTERVEVKIVREVYSTGAYTPASTMGGMDYLINGEEGYIAAGKGDDPWNFQETERRYFIPKLSERGGEGSGHFEHEGRPGEVGGSLPGDQKDFDNESERASVLVPTGPQTFSPREGVTREQVQHYHNRRKATEAASRTKYRDGSTAKELIDQTFADGFSEIKRERFGYVLKNPDTEVTRKFKHKEERDYIDTLLSHGNFSLNYEIVERAIWEGEPKLTHRRDEIESVIIEVRGPLRRIVITSRSHSRSKCMECGNKPVVATHWANGHGMAWFCFKHFKSWVKEDDRDIVGVWVLKEGECPEDIRKTPSGTEKIRKLGEPISIDKVFSRIEALIKRGGEGSGHYEHEGRLGEVGGSKPGKRHVGLTSARPGKSSREVFTQMRDFRAKLGEIGGVSDVSVEPGLGGWEGGREPTWVIQFRGNGKANSLIAQTALDNDQDGVLLIDPCDPPPDCAPVIDFHFSDQVTPSERDVVESMMVAQGVGGWTWYRREGEYSSLRAVYVPDWEERGTDDYYESLERLRFMFDQAQMPHLFEAKQASMSVMNKEGENSYGDFLGRGTD